ncbi:MAG TPA: hypothetical protein PKJ98_09810 [Verrucomicrobiota bacterium]|nr:hypothetical protein [Verrucomicrobiota bacterium]
MTPSGTPAGTGSGPSGLAPSTAGPQAFQLLLGLLLLVLEGFPGEPPRIDYVYPMGASTGASCEVEVGGRWESWPLEGWADDDAVRFRAVSSNGWFQLDVAASATPGPRLIRFFDARGASPPRVFMIGTGVELTEPAASRATTFNAVERYPAAVNGRLTTPDEPDRVPLLIAGECLARIRVITRGLDSPILAQATLLDPTGFALGRTPEYPGGDAQLACPIAVGGLYQLEIRPMASAPGTPVDPAAAIYRLEIRIDGLDHVPRESLTGGNVNEQRLAPVVYTARTLMVPSLTRAVVTPPGREILYEFQARQSEQYRFVARVGSIGSPLQPVLRVLDAARQPLAEASPAPDPVLTWIAPSTDMYYLLLTDRRGEGGPLHTCQIEVDRPRNTFQTRLPAHAFRVMPGETRRLTVTVLRPPGSEDFLTLTAMGLPEGVSAAPVQVPPEEVIVPLEFVASQNARPDNRPFRVLCTRTTDVPPAFATARFSLEPRHAQPAQLLVRESDQPWLTVLPAPCEP